MVRTSEADHLDEVGVKSRGIMVMTGGIDIAMKGGKGGSMRLNEIKDMVGIEIMEEIEIEVVIGNMDEIGMIGKGTEIKVEVRVEEMIGMEIGEEMTNGETIEIGIGIEIGDSMISPLALMSVQPCIMIHSLYVDGFHAFRCHDDLAFSA